MARIFFDFDGVLVQSRNADKTFLWQKNIEQDLNLPTSVKNQLFEQPEWNEIISGKDDFQQKIQKVFQQNNLSISTDEFISYWLSHDLNWRHDVLDLASKLKKAGHSLYLATNQDKIRSAHITKQKEISDLFENIFSSCNLRVSKPNPEFYKQIQSQNFSKETNTFFMIDDDQRNIEAANSSGWTGIYFNPDLEETLSIEDQLTLIEQKIFTL